MVSQPCRMQLLSNRLAATLYRQTYIVIDIDTGTDTGTDVGTDRDRDTGTDIGTDRDRDIDTQQA